MRTQPWRHGNSSLFFALTNLIFFLGGWTKFSGFEKSSKNSSIQSCTILVICLFGRLLGVLSRKNLLITSPPVSFWLNILLPNSREFWRVNISLLYHGEPGDKLGKGSSVDIKCHCTCSETGEFSSFESSHSFIKLGLHGVSLIFFCLSLRSLNSNIITLIATFKFILFLILFIPLIHFNIGSEIYSLDRLIVKIVR